MVSAPEVDGHFFDTTLQLGLARTGRFKVFAKAGVMYWQLNYEATAQTSGGVSESAMTIRIFFESRTRCEF